jgi:signal transduction histidine kinase/DNA-binding response OmpR family regulator
VRYNPESKVYSAVDTKGLVNSAIVDMQVADSSTLLLGTDGDGLMVLNIATGGLHNYNIGLLGIDSQKLKVHSIMRDNRGGLWLGCFQQGVIMEPAVENEFHYIGSRSSVANNIGSCCVTSVFNDRNGNVWVGTDNDGIYLLNSDFSQKRHFPAEHKAGSVPRTTLCIYRDSHGSVWVGSYLDGLFRLDEKSGRCQSIPLANQNDFRLSPSVYSIGEDSRHNLWVAVSGIGLYRINTLTLEQKLYRTMANDISSPLTENRLPNTWINKVLVCGNRVYLGSYDGLCCFDIDKEDFTSAFGTNRVLAGEIIYDLLCDEDGIIWLATANGLFSFNPQNNESTRYTMINGLPNNSVASLRCGADNNLWISTSNGISCMNRQTGFFSNYYASDGLQCNEFSKGASAVSSDGMLIYGGMNGLICFYPQKIKKHCTIPRVRISNFYINNTPVTKAMLSDGRPIVDCDITKADKVWLSSTDNSFTIEFTALEYASRDRISYWYNMDGKGWIRLQQWSNKVSFSNLKPGKHEFCVRSGVMTADAISFSKIRRLTIQIAAPWYATRLAYALYLFAAAMAVLIVLLYMKRDNMLKMKIMEHKYAEDINEAKLQFFINISHEIRTPMSLIMGPIQKLISTDDNPERQHTYNIIYRNAERILGLVNQLMDIRKIDKGQMKLHLEEVDVVRIVQSVCDNFSFQASSQDVTLNCNADQQPIMAWVDTAHFDKIIVNILSNAFKFTPKDGTINVVVRKEAEPATDGHVVIDIEDSGPGVSAEDLSRIFERFYQSPTNGKTISGTGVGLHLTKSLVELHHGTISAANNVGKPGCHFTVRIPLGSSHLSVDDKMKPSAVRTEPKPDTANAPVAQIAEKKSSRVNTKTKYHVLVVEDDDEIRQYLKTELAADFHVQVCANGAEALELILKKAPDIVVSDVMMPVMDGVTLCKKIKQNITINSLPVILLTSLTNESNIIEGLDVGADAYITKPFSIELLRHTLLNKLQSRIILKNNFQGSQTQETKIEKPDVVTPDDRLMQRIMKVINANISNPDLNVDMLATTVGISRAHLHRKMKELTNQSTHIFIRNVRLQQAAQLLREGRQSVSEISDVVGFVSTAHFSTAFKDLFGLTPSEYMRQHSMKK